jgi:hypothetical protein
MNEHTDELRAQVARNAGLAPVWAERLQGETVEELQADADKLRAVVGEAPAVPRASRRQGQIEHTGQVPGPSMSDRIRAGVFAKIYGRHIGYIGGGPGSLNDRIRAVAGYERREN